ncbi:MULTISPECIES: ATP-binding protein [Thermomonospora]|uniref:histidine kinase n=1 Tax=Thermomonospora cellulosilytica TaxID=1411118 RepID=A0A7W3R8C9_9ACTN|nr:MULTISPECIES: ATP-binding protein [Thermomonospora]MBA9003571.1 signal transduction histidine kinase [Thermomonospora cellulosilytica]
MGTKIAIDELRPLFLFEGLTDEQLGVLAEYGRVHEYEPDSEVCRQGDPAEYLYVLLDGEIALTKNVQGHEVELTRGSRPGVYGGATQAYLGDRIEQRYQNTLRTLARTRLFALPARKFAHIVAAWFPMGRHLLEGLFFGMSNAKQLVDQRERLTALGTITAGLTHELNNPAAAAARANAELGDRMISAQQLLAKLAVRGVDCHRLSELVMAPERLAKRAAQAASRTPLQVSDAEDELGERLDSLGVQDAWELAPILVSAGFEPADIDEVNTLVGAEHLPLALRWLAVALEVGQLQEEITDALTRITALLGSARQYSQLDRAANRPVDLRELLDSTLTMMKRKIGDGVRVRTSYDPDLPQITVYAAELNQVWTNLIDNALYAMGGSGTLTVRTAREGDRALVEIADTGPGIPEENLERIFTPFFTTKPVGEGTGLGLDISWRIVVDRHGGDIRVESRPGDTRFQVLLPIS